MVEEVVPDQPADGDLTLLQPLLFTPDIHTLPRMAPARDTGTGR
jgi:hypothetical protein